MIPGSRSFFSRRSRRTSKPRAEAAFAQKANARTRVGGRAFTRKESVRKKITTMWQPQTRASTPQKSNSAHPPEAPRCRPGERALSDVGRRLRDVVGALSPFGRRPRGCRSGLLSVPCQYEARAGRFVPSGTFFLPTPSRTYRACTHAPGRLASCFAVVARRHPRH